MFRVYNTEQEVVCQHGINLNQWYRYLLSSRPTTVRDFYRSVFTLHSISTFLCCEVPTYMLPSVFLYT